MLREAGRPAPCSRMTVPITLAELAAIDLRVLRGVGEKRLDALHELGLETVLDLLTFYPRRWVDRTNEARVRDLQPGQDALVLVTVRSVTRRPTRSRKVMVTV